MEKEVPPIVIEGLGKVIPAFIEDMNQLGFAARKLHICFVPDGSGVVAIKFVWWPPQEKRNAGEL